MRGFFYSMVPVSHLGDGGFLIRLFIFMRRFYNDQRDDHQPEENEYLIKSAELLHRIN